MAARDDSGFTLVELLMIVLIVGLLAAIATPVYLNQRQSGWRAAATSDVRNAALEVETFEETTGGYPTAAEFAGLDTVESAGVTTTYVRLSAHAYRVDADHAQLPGSPDVRYCSLDGGLQADPMTTCSTS